MGGHRIPHLKMDHPKNLQNHPEICLLGLLYPVLWFFEKFEAVQTDANFDQKSILIGDISWLKTLFLFDYWCPSWLNVSRIC